mmetsp:Transcript_5923/g.8259  ORF Transcript_5923/g.8259 Transcript_5923/m.8259 type:complete len:164 (+) Transcript_5923:1817-2308(+)
MGYSGNAQGCAAMSAAVSFSSSSSTGSASSVEQNLTIAFVLLAVGIIFSCIAYLLYNRYMAYRAGESKFRYETAWQTAAPVDGTHDDRIKLGRTASPVTSRPASLKFSENNPGVKMSRSTAASAPVPRPESMRVPLNLSRGTEIGPPPRPKQHAIPPPPPKMI